MSEWKPIETAPKHPLTIILICTDDGIVTEASWDDDGWSNPYTERGGPLNAKWWMPLPNPPNGT
jgi:hypothetical protein